MWERRRPRDVWEQTPNRPCLGNRWRAKGLCVGTNRVVSIEVSTSEMRRGKKRRVLNSPVPGSGFQRPHYVSGGESICHAWVSDLINRVIDSPAWFEPRYARNRAGSRPKGRKSSTAQFGTLVRPLETLQGNCSTSSSRAISQWRQDRGKRDARCQISR